MGVLLQGFFKLPPNKALPSPTDGIPGVPWWWDHIAAQAQAFSLAGFSAIWLPPVLKTSSGASAGADGYGFLTTTTGSRTKRNNTHTIRIPRSVAALRGHLPRQRFRVYLDMVEHQRSGDTTPFVFRYPGANGTPDAGRFPKNPSNFVPQVPRDPNLGGPPRMTFPSEGNWPLSMG